MGGQPSGARLGTGQDQSQSQEDRSDFVLEVVNQTGMKLYRSHVDPGEIADSLPEVLTSRQTLTVQDVGQPEVYINYINCKPRQPDQAGTSRIRRPTEIPEALPVILTVYAAVVDGGLRASIFGGAHRLDMAAMFDRLPEHGDNLRKLACRQGSLGVCSWKQSLAPRSAVLTVTQPPTSISQQRAAMLDALQSSIPIATKLRDQSSPTKDDAKEEGCEAILAGQAPTDVASAEPDPPSSQPVSAPSSCRSSSKSQAEETEETAVMQMAQVEEAPRFDSELCANSAPSCPPAPTVDVPSGNSPSRGFERESQTGHVDQEPCNPCPAPIKKDAPGRSRSGALALQVQKALKERQEKEEAQRKCEEEEALMKANCSAVIAFQDIEYQRSLLHDQVRDLRKEHSKLQDLERSLSSALDDSRQRRQSAETRLSRYGENPRIRAEAEKATEEESALLPELTDVSRRLAHLKETLEEKEELLCMAALADDT